MLVGVEMMERLGLRGRTQPMVKGWEPLATLSWMKASASTAVSVSQ
jgi:hypothetical protein